MIIRTRRFACCSGTKLALMLHRSNRNNKEGRLVLKTVSKCLAPSYFNWRWCASPPAPGSCDAEKREYKYTLLTPEDGLLHVWLPVLVMLKIMCVLFSFPVLAVLKMMCVLFSSQFV